MVGLTYFSVRSMCHLRCQVIDRQTGKTFKEVIPGPVWSTLKGLLLGMRKQTDVLRMKTKNNFFARTPFLKLDGARIDICKNDLQIVGCCTALTCLFTLSAGATVYQAKAPLKK